MAAELGVGKNTVWRWRSGIMNALDGLPGPTLDHVVAADLQVVRDSRKASREWVRHAADPATSPAPDRPRWIDVDRGRLPEPLPRARFRIPLVAVIDALDGKRAMLRGDLKHGLAGETWRHRGRATTGRTLDRGTGHDAAATERAVRPGTAGQRSMAVDPGQHAGLERPGDALRSFLLPFRGPATRHLRGYLAWFSAIRSTAPAASPTRLGDMRHPHPSIPPP